MYESHWRLESKPFENSADARFYYPGEAHQGALLKLRYAIESRKGAALLAGAPGLGKTLLAHALFRQLPEPYNPRVQLVFPQMPPEQLIGWLADELSGGQGEPATIERNVRRLEQALAENVKLGRHAVVVIDEAQLLRSSNALETIRLLLNLDHHSQPALTILLVGQPALLPALDRMPELDERLGVKCLLRPFSLEETSGYIHHRLRAAGAAQPIFDGDAIDAVHHLSHGAPRRINRLCDLALLVGFAEERESLGAEQIEAVAQELVAVAPE